MIINQTEVFRVRFQYSIDEHAVYAGQKGGVHTCQVLFLGNFMSFLVIVELLLGWVRLDQL